MFPIWIFLVIIIRCSNPFVPANNAVDNWKNYAEFKYILYTKVLWSEGVEKEFKISLLPGIKLVGNTFKDKLINLENKIKENYYKKIGSIFSQSNTKFYDVSKLIEIEKDNTIDSNLVSNLENAKTDSYKYFSFLRILNYVHVKTQYDDQRKTELGSYIKDVVMGRMLSYIAYKNNRDIRISNLIMKDFSGTQIKVGNTNIYVPDTPGEYEMDNANFDLKFNPDFAIKDSDDIAQIGTKLAIYKKIQMGKTYDTANNYPAIILNKNEMGNIVNNLIEREIIGKTQNAFFNKFIRLFKNGLEQGRFVTLGRFKEAFVDDPKSDFDVAYISDYLLKDKILYYKANAITDSNSVFQQVEYILKGGIKTYYGSDGEKIEPTKVTPVYGDNLDSFVEEVKNVDKFQEFKTGAVSKFKYLSKGLDTTSFKAFVSTTSKDVTDSQFGDGEASHKYVFSVFKETHQYFSSSEDNVYSDFAKNFQGCTTSFSKRDGVSCSRNTVEISERPQPFSTCKSILCSRKYAKKITTKQLEVLKIINEKTDCCFQGDYSPSALPSDGWTGNDIIEGAGDGPDSIARAWKLVERKYSGQPRNDKLVQLLKDDIEVTEVTEDNVQESEALYVMYRNMGGTYTSWKNIKSLKPNAYKNLITKLGTTQDISLKVQELGLQLEFRDYILSKRVGLLSNIEGNTKQDVSEQELDVMDDNTMIFSIDVLSTSDRVSLETINMFQTLKVMFPEDTNILPTENPTPDSNGDIKYYDLYKGSVSMEDAIGMATNNIDQKFVSKSLETKALHKLILYRLKTIANSLKSYIEKEQPDKNTVTYHGFILKKIGVLSSLNNDIGDGIYTGGSIPEEPESITKFNIDVEPKTIVVSKFGTKQLKNGKFLTKSTRVSLSGKTSASSKGF